MINSKIYGKNNVELVVYLKVQKYTIFVRYGNNCLCIRNLFSKFSLHFSYKAMERFTFIKIKAIQTNKICLRI